MYIIMYLEVNACVVVSNDFGAQRLTVYVLIVYLVLVAVKGILP